MKDYIPPVVDLPVVQGETTFFFVKEKEKKVHELDGYISPPNCTGTQKC
jgi:thioredoxin-related protein